MRRVLWLLAALSWAASLWLCRQAEGYGNGIYVLLDSPLAGTEAADILEREAEREEPTGVCFYALGANTYISCPDTGNSAKVTLVPVMGNPGLLGAQALTWRRGCVLDRATAQALFGTAEAGAQQVTVEGETRTALDVLPALTATALASAENGDSLTHCVLPGWTETGKETAESFLLRHGLSGKILNVYPLLVFVRNACLLPLWAALFVLCNLIRKENSRLGWLPLAVGAVFLANWVTVPKDAIPSLWSDFSFWGTWLQGLRENFLAIVTAYPGDWALQMERDMIQSVLCALAGTLFVAWGGRRKNHASAAH